MKVMYVNTLGTWGGVATYLSLLIKDQINKNNEIWLITGSNEGFTKSIMKDYPSVHIIIISSLTRDIHPLKLCRAVKEFRILTKKINPDIIHLNCIMAGIMGRIGCIGQKIPIIYNAHGWAFEPGNSKKYKWPAIIIEKVLSYFTTKIICVSNYEYSIANKWHIFKNDSQGIVIKNATYDIEGDNKNKPNDNIFRITMAARFWEGKDYIDLIHAFYILSKRLLPHKNIKLYLLGNGPTLNYCKNLVSNFGINKNVIFTGKVNNVLDYYNDSDIVTLITYHEAISISLIEALSMSKPIVASNVSGVPENFDKNGFCVDNVPIEIANSLKNLIVNNKLRKKMGNNSRKLFLKEFTQDKNLKKHNNLYNAIKYKNERM